MKPAVSISAIAIVFWGLLCPISGGADIDGSKGTVPFSLTRKTVQSPDAFLSGPALQNRLDESVDLILSENPLRQALENMGRNENVAVLVDRRIDPDRKIEISLQHTPLKDAVQAIAAKYDFGISMVGPVAYFAPLQTARCVRTLAALRRDEARQLTLAAAKKFFERKGIAWEDFSTPRDLLEKLGAESGIEIAGLEQVPHDLWAGADLPPLELIERITLIAGQYDLTFKISDGGDKVTLIAIPQRVELERSYPAGRGPEETVKKFAAIAPDARIKIAGDRIIVAGLLEDHERIANPKIPAQPRQTKSPRADDSASKRYSLKIVEQPIGPLLKQLAAQLNLQIKIDEKAVERAGISLDKRVSFEIKGATIDVLLDAALGPAGLKFTRQGNIVEIEPAR